MLTFDVTTVLPPHAHWQLMTPVAILVYCRYSLHCSKVC